MINRATPPGLKKLIYLVVSYLQVTSPDLCQVGRIRFMEYIIGVLLILYSQAELESGVAPDIVIHCSAGFLRGQNKMDP